RDAPAWSLVEALPRPRDERRDLAHRGPRHRHEAALARDRDDDGTASELGLALAHERPEQDGLRAVLVEDRDRVVRDPPLVARPAGDVRQRLAFDVAERASAEVALGQPGDRVALIEAERDEGAHRLGTREQPAM